MRWIAMVLVLGMVGCSAGSTYELMAMDNLILTSKETEKSLLAYDIAARAAFEKRREEVWKKVGRNVEKIALSKDETKESAKTLSIFVVSVAKKDLKLISEDDRERQKHFETALDNLRYIREVSERVKDFAITRMDVSKQWKEYLQAQRSAYFRDRKDGG